MADEKDDGGEFDGFEDEVGPDNFHVIAKLGQGSFGIVYLVDRLNIITNDMGITEKVETGEQYAMKILNKKQIMTQNLVKYAKTERDVLTYTSHPFIVGMRFAFQTPEKLFMILDYAAGGNMSRALHKEKRFPEAKAVLYLAEILLALEDLHNRDIVYRDLKPDNVVFDAQGHAMLTDFGLAKESIGGESLAKSFCGSPAYLAPEMLKRKGHGQAIDWYLLGVLLYEMLVGIPPYYSNNKEQLYENIQRGPLKLPSFLTEDARQLLIALLNRNPEKRLGSGPKGADEIKRHKFLKPIDWRVAEAKKLPVPSPYLKKYTPQEVPFEKVYGLGAKDEQYKNHNRIGDWSFIGK
jgi:serine/threonine protein kinase